MYPGGRLARDEVRDKPGVPLNSHADIRLRSSPTIFDCTVVTTRYHGRDWASPGIDHFTRFVDKESVVSPDTGPLDEEHC